LTACLYQAFVSTSGSPATDVKILTTPARTADETVDEIVDEIVDETSADFTIVGVKPALKSTKYVLKAVVK
jgi:F420-dependent methylenetetrahydromethanopterin dehydrogenase